MFSSEHDETNFLKKEQIVNSQQKETNQLGPQKTVIHTLPRKETL